MPQAKNYRTLHERVIARPGAEGRLVTLREHALAEVGLYELRRSREMSQVQLADRLKVKQPAVSKLENAGDLRLSTLRDYIEGLGGTLELRARFDDETVTLTIPSTS